MGLTDVEHLTYEEHCARAMLMGLEYDWRDGTYNAPDGMDSWDANNMIDCLTLQPITYEEARNRKVVPYEECSHDERDQYVGVLPWEVT